MPPFARTGPGLAEDGKPKYDLTQFNQAYFDRMRARVIEAGDRGMYVAVVLFNGWSVVSSKGSFAANNPWRGHPYNATNNINGVNGDVNNNNSGEETHELAVAQVTAFQEAYVLKVIDTLNDLDNVMYEISNESHDNSQAWQYHMINYIKSAEATRAQQHLVGMTVEWPNGNNGELYASPADWISPNGSIDSPVVNDGSKAVLLDTDHLCGICGDRTWVWKAFTRGHNPIFMDGYDGAGYGVGGEGFDFSNPTWVSLRANLGYTRYYAGRIDLANMTPRGDLATSGYCLAKPTPSGAAYLVYLPAGGSVQVNLSAAAGTLTVEWFRPSNGSIVQGSNTTGGATRSFQAPFSGDAVLYIYDASAAATPTSTATATAINTATATATGTNTPTATATGTNTPDRHRYEHAHRHRYEHAHRHRHRYEHTHGHRHSHAHGHRHGQYGNAHPDAGYYANGIPVSNTRRAR